MNSANEITLSVKGRKSGKDIPRPVWFAYGDDILYLLPVQGSDTNWYKNFLAESMLKIYVHGDEVNARGKPITDGNSVNNIISNSNLDMVKGM